MYLQDFLTGFKKLELVGSIEQIKLLWQDHTNRQLLRYTEY